MQEIRIDIVNYQKFYREVLRKFNLSARDTVEVSGGKIKLYGNAGQNIPR